MEYIKATLLIPAILLLSWQSHASPLAGCSAKKQEVENQISFALAHKNTYQITGLQKALREIEEHCNEPQLRKQRQLKIMEKEKKVAERQAELERARETGNAKKMVQKQKKLERAREELQDVQNIQHQ
ncbi:DUF1090 domain-containing protein [Salmonella enterica]|nr:DUF1090 domain-containing protein [Salmonella enterica]ECY4646982.1 DUF1090 domain-containing protein [Salmonella enterica subsp. enterica serovar Eastbourne]EDU9493658.1 DUF1090 domain-containing protein [Salmonella enterica subsp. enterica]EDV0774473.1 DUF1090 domain-containing protein [Salmonella enterica subsp. enterica]EIN0011561.1 DUF1090 domain-containing protein [Salmonella enterica]